MKAMLISTLSGNKIQIKKQIETNKILTRIKVLSGILVFIITLKKLNNLLSFTYKNKKTVLKNEIYFAENYLR